MTNIRKGFIVSRGTRFAAVAAARHAGHHLGDYWAQTHHQATTKGAAGATGVWACLRHVAGYTAVNVVAVAAANRVLGLGLSWRAIAVGELVSAATHYAADRRDHGVLPAAAKVTGSEVFYINGGAPLLDQAWHHGWNAVAAAVTAVWGDR